MSTLFARTEGALRRDDAGAILVLSGLALILSLGWVIWMFAADVPLYALSNDARLESPTLRWVDSPVDALVEKVYVRLGDRVAVGQLLVELNSSTERLRESEQEVKRASMEDSAQRLTREIELETAALRQSEAASEAVRAEAQARYKEAEGLAQLAEAEAHRAEQLFDRGLQSEQERDRILAEAARRKNASATLSAAMRRVATERQVEESGKRVVIERLKAQLASAKGGVEGSDLGRQLAGEEIRKRQLRAPIAGRIGDEILVREGSMIAQGGRVASIIPEDRVVVVAQFRPETASGRIEPGQLAKFAFDAFPQVEYGLLDGLVSRVASEPQQGMLRVEVAVKAGGIRVPLRHGLTGQLRIETERTSPVRLLLRTVGKRLSSSRVETPPGSDLN